MKPPITIIPIRQDFLNNARGAGRDDQGQPVETHIAKGGEPCRDVLRGAHPGEKIILASYCPFTESGPYKEYGPVFILAEDAGERPALDCLPLPKGEATDYLGQTFVLRAYSEKERIIGAVLASPENAQSHLDDFFGNEEVKFVLARYAGYGCYGFRVERA